MSELQTVIKSRNVDLDQLESFITYLASGVSLFNNSFTIIKSAPSQASIPLSEAQKLRVEFSKLIGGKPKSFIRTRLPIYFVALVDFANKRGQGVSLTTNIKKFVAMARSIDASSATSDTIRGLLNCLEALNQTYYLTPLNRKLDRLNYFFRGEAPNSFTKMLAEATELTASKLQSLLPTTSPPSLGPPPTKVLTLVPPSTINVLSPLPTLTNTRKVPEANTEAEDEPSKDFTPEEIENVEQRILGLKKSTFIWTSVGLVTLLVSYNILKE